MKPRSDTNSKAKPLRRVDQAKNGANAERQAHCRNSQSRELQDGKELPADRGSCEPESTVQGSE